MQLPARVDVSSMPFRQRLALALAVLFGRDGAAVPVIAEANRAQRRALARKGHPPV